MKSKDIHRIDNILIGMGRISFLAVLLMALWTFGIEYITLSLNPDQHMYEIDQDGQISTLFSSDDIVTMREAFPASEVREVSPSLESGPSLFYILCPFVLLLVGGFIRRQENKVIDIWNLLELKGEVTIHDIQQETGQQRTEILKAIQLINRQGEETFEFDRKRDTLFDSRLSDLSAFIETCASCGEPISEQVRVSLAQPQKCPYCRSVLLTKDVMKSHGLVMPAPQTLKVATNFSIVVFLVFLFFWWPLAILYAIIKTRLFGRFAKQYTEMQYSDPA